MPAHVPPPSYELLHARTVRVERGLVRMSFSTHPGMRGAQGAVQSGVLAAMAEAAIDAAVRSVAGRSPVTLEIKASFLSAAAPGEELTCEAQVLRYGDSTAYIEASLTGMPESSLPAALPADASLGALPADISTIRDKPLAHRAPAADEAIVPQAVKLAGDTDRVIARVSATCFLLE